MTTDLHLVKTGRFVLFPVVHHSYEFALAARQAFAEVQPAAVAIEYPAGLQSLIQQGIQRLPRISVVVYGEPRKYIRIEPVDAFVEAGRLAGEHKIPIACIDSTANYPEVFDPMPDTFALRHAG